MAYFRSLITNFIVLLNFSYGVISQGNNNDNPFPWWIFISSYPTPFANRCNGQQARRSCNLCIHSHPSCYWCNYDNTCRMLPTGRTHPYPGDCPNDEWHLNQCIINGSVFVYLIPVAIVIVAIGITIIIYCCCCRYQSRENVTSLPKITTPNRQSKKTKQSRLKSQQIHESIRSKYKLRSVAGLTRGSSDDSFSWEDPNRITSSRSSLGAKMKLFRYKKLNDDDSVISSLVFLPETASYDSVSDGLNLLTHTTTLIQITFDCYHYI
ncbi:uncharacterized protein TRIADDRAFT_51780 [Trichoplax adhaerens]|uniref:PSI domain-containing protein n=1 Tax=Trichoplax adhaerens TaxID=10228 RepID=B3RKV5_TRIAD|nr:predicted protein [Trichoplax adhaerens]EDV28653.1 predicted protein [Trichoplax adhaerens]|eukprot:XP_002107855.1 predicted protein [Trichoplax adhaerens]